MAKPTLQKYLSYLSEKPRTFGWGALLAYDRFKTNRLLAQEHIERFNEGSWLPLINFRVQTENNSWTEVRDLRMDKPRLSFVNSNIASSKARLSMNVISGVITQLRQAPGSEQSELVNYSQLDPLTAPTVRMDIYLNESNSGAVNEEGRVTLDLAKGGSYTFEISSWKEMNEKLGEAIQKEFEKWPDASRVWELNVLKPVEGELNPTSFAVRTHSLARSQQIGNASAEEQEEGAVLVGVAFNQAQNGNFPVRDADLPYLLPKPEGSSEPDYSMNLVYSNESWFKRILFSMLSKIDSLPNPELKQSGKGFYDGVNSNVRLSVPGQQDNERRDYGDRFSVNEFKWPDLEFSGTFSFTAGYNKLNVLWTAESLENKCVVTFIGPGGTSVMRPSADIKLSVSSELTFELVTEGERAGEINLKPGPINSKIEPYLSGSEHSFRDAQATEASHDYMVPHIKTIADRLSSEIEAISAMKIPFNLLRINSLLFRSDDVATPRALHVPGDLSLLGDLAPRLTAFAVEPLEATVSAGSGDSVAFKLEPATSGTVTWTVKALPGESGEVGSIANGVYTPPSVGSITGTHKRVIVTAQANNSQSSALVTVVPNSVSVYPNFEQANFANGNDQPRYVLVGGDVKSTLNWAMASGSKGRIREVESGDDDLDIPVDKNVRIYVSPERATGETGLAALVHVDRVEVSAGGQTQGIEMIIPWRTATGSIKATAQGTGAVKLALSYTESETGDTVELAPKDTLWGVLKGTGTIDESTGIYTPGNNEAPYIIVAAKQSFSSPIAIWNYTVLPIPYNQNYTALLEYVQAQTLKARF